jgi:ribosomal protein L15
MTMTISREAEGSRRRSSVSRGSGSGGGGGRGSRGGKATAAAQGCFTPSPGVAALGKLQVFNRVSSQDTVFQLGLSLVLQVVVQ